jgi:signal transduction histidine kinase/DNA-binding NarL/FixJ family response regulator
MWQKQVLSTIFAVVILVNTGILAQRVIPEYGIKNFGLSVEQPFHSADNISQDSLGRLLFSNYVYDGNAFKRSASIHLNPILIEEDGRWYQLSNYEVNFQSQDTTLLINLKEHFTLPGGNAIVSDGADKYILTLEGILHFIWNGKELEFIEKIKTEGEGNLDFILINDTIFLKKVSGADFLVADQLNKSTQHLYENHTDQINGIIPLTGNRIALKNENRHVIFHRNHPYNRFIKNIGDREIITHLIDSKNRLWLSTRIEGNSKLYLLDHNNPLQTIDLKIESSAYMLDLYEDNYGNIWVGSQGQGLILVYEEGIKVINKDSGLSTDNIWSISQRTNGDIYLAGSCSGIDVIDQNRNIGHIFGTGCQGSIFFDSKDNLWINSNGVHILSPDGKIVNLTKESGLTSRTTTTILEDSSGTIWIGTRKAVHRYTGDGFKKYAASSVDEFDRVLAMREYAQGKFIIGFVSGKVFSFDGKTFLPLDYPGQGLNTIFKDRNDHIWVCSDSSGLYLFQEEAFISVTAPSLPSSIKLIQDDLNNSMWGLCENNQVFRFNIKDAVNKMGKLKVDYFGIDEGVPLIATNNDVQPNTALLNDGRIIFPNIYGAIIIDPVKLYKGISSSYTQVLLNDSVVTDGIRLPYGNNDLTLDLNTIHISPNETFSYQYTIGKLTYNMGKETRISLNDLPKGNHTLVIKGKSIKSDWHTLQGIDIYVPPLIYQYSLFWFAIISLLVTGIFIFIRWRTKLINQRNTILKQKVEEQTLIIEQEKAHLAKALKKQLELTKELNMTQQAKNRMYAQISHEFKSPLQVINTHLSSNNGRMIPQDRQRIQKNIANLLEISNEIMDLSKAESGQLKIKKNYYNINSVIQDQIDLKKDLIEEKQIQVIYQKSKDLQFLEIDLSLMQKVFNNLISNAIKFSPFGGTIKVITENGANSYSVYIKDEGPGIPDDEVNHLTMAYYQASNNQEEGTGIGLSLVSEILKLHKTNLEIKSEQGKGSRFGFTLPLPLISQKAILKKHSFSSDLKEQLRTHTDPTKPLIIIVEDSQDVQYFLRQSLQKNYRIISASNGRSALEFLSSVQPDLVITDQIMPIMSGVELIKRIRSRKKLMSVPILLLTGSLLENIKVKAIKAGADQILQKPIDEQLLDGIIEKTLERKKVIEDSSKLSLAHDLLSPSIHNDDSQLITNLEVIFLDHIDNGRLKSDEIASKMGLGEKTLRNKVKAITGMTVKEYFKKFRLEKAQLLIEENHGTLGEIAIATGFSSLSHFSKSYKAFFGKNAAKQGI